jgi:hypothetical protein
MSSRNRQSSNSIAVWIGAALLSLPFLYVLSIGPAARLASGGSFATLSAVHHFYFPLELIARRSRTAEKVLNWYIALWTDN